MSPSFCNVYNAIGAVTFYPQMWYFNFLSQKIVAVRTVTNILSFQANDRPASLFVEEQIIFQLFSSVFPTGDAPMFC